MEEVQRYEPKVRFAKLCSDLNVDLEDAINTEILSWHASDPSSLNLAVSAHVDVLLHKAEIVAAALEVGDLDVLYEVTSGLALLEDLAPWSPQLLGEVRSRVDRTDVRHGDETVLDDYRRWLVGDHAEGLPRAKLTAAAALAISCALVPEVDARGNPQAVPSD